MKVRFILDTTRAVPFYARLCNQFLRHPLIMGIGYDDNGYRVEAEGDEQGLSDLANLVGRTFPYSCWLKTTTTAAIEQFSGEARELETEPQSQPYCRLCRDQVHSDCIHCGAPAEHHLVPDGHSLKTYVATLAQTLIDEGQISFANRHGQCTLFGLNQAQANCDQLLFCQPERLNTSLHIGDGGIKLLGAIEKPRLRLVPRAEFAQANGLTRSLYYVQLADDRLTLALTEHLAELGITAVIYDTDYRALTLGLWGDEPVVLCSGEQPAPATCHPPKRDRVHLKGLSAHWDGNQVRFQSLDDAGHRLVPEYAAACALEAERQQQRIPRQSAVFYLGREHHNGLLFHKDGSHHWMVRLPTEPRSVADILAAIRAKDTGKRLLAQYESHHAGFLPSLSTGTPRQLDGSFTSVMAMAAWFTGLDGGNDATRAAEKLLAAAIRHDGPAPRIDFKLVRKDGVLEVDWTAAFQACLSFRLANHESLEAIAFGILDSFADFVANWAEQLDHDIGLDEVVLAGDEFHNPLLLDRLRLRLGKNLNLRLPDPLGIAGTNLVLGALHLDASPITKMHV